MVLICGVVLSDVMFMLNLGLFNARVQLLVASPDRVAHWLDQFAGAGANLTVLDACNTTLAANSVDFAMCAVGAFPCAVAVANGYDAQAVGHAATNSTSLPASDGGADGVWTYATASLGGTCLFSSDYNWGYYVARLAWSSQTLLIVAGVAAAGAALALFMRLMARDQGRNYVLAENLLLRNVVIDVPVVLQYIALVAVYAELCWECLAAPTCGGCATAGAPPPPSQLLLWFVIGLALRLAHLAELMVRMFLNPDRPAVSGLGVAATLPLWLPLLASVLTVTVCLEATGFVFRMTSGTGVGAVAKVGAVGIPVGITVCVLSAMASLVFYWHLVRRARSDGPGTKIQARLEAAAGASASADDVMEMMPVAASGETSAPASPRPSMDADGGSDSSRASSPTKLLRPPRDLPSRGHEPKDPPRAAMTKPVRADVPRANAGSLGHDDLRLTGAVSPSPQAHRAGNGRSISDPVTVTVAAGPGGLANAHASAPARRPPTSAPGWHNGRSISAPVPAPVHGDHDPRRGSSESTAGASPNTTPPGSPPKSPSRGGPGASNLRLLDDYSPTRAGGSAAAAGRSGANSRPSDGSPASSRSISVDSVQPPSAQRRLFFG